MFARVTPYIDEDMRSLVFRYASMHVARAQKLYMREEIKIMSFSPLLTDSIRLFMLLPDNYYKDINEFLAKHSYISICNLFLVEKKRDNLLKFMHIGKSESGMPNPYIYSYFSEDIRYCPLCVQTDVSTCGECYIHRNHQIKISSYCPIHKVKLITKCIQCNQLLTDGFNYQLSDSKCPSCQTAKFYQHEESVAIDEELQVAQVLIELSNQQMKLEDLHIRIHASLNERGYIAYGGKVKKKEVVSELFKRYGQYLNKLDLRENDINVKLFLTLDYNYKYLPLLLCLLLMINYKEPSLGYFNPIPFGSGPWDCINKICPDFGQKGIKQCRRRVRWFITGIFECQACKMIYVLKCKNGVDRNFPFIIDYGFLWNDTVLLHFKQGKTIKWIAQHMGASEPTISKFLRGRGNNENINMEKLQLAEDSDFIDHKKTKLRSKIYDLLQSEQSLDRRQICKAMSVASYVWMLKYDKLWLESVLPSKKRNESKYLNYTELDQEMKEYFEILLIKIRGNSSNEKITRRFIIRCSNNTVYFNRLTGSHKNKFIETNSIINAAVESREEHIRRTISFMIVKTQEKFNLVTLNYLKVANPKLKTCSSDLEEWLIEQVVHYNKHNISKV